MFQTSIPKVIHQLWVNKDGSNRSFPPKYNVMRQTLLDKNPDFEFKVWLDNDIMALFKEPELAPYKDTYLNMRYAISKADFARMLVIYTQGGFYVDLDFYCYRPLRELLERFSNQPVIITKEFDEGGPPMIYNGFIATYPRNKFFLGFIQYMGMLMKDIDQTGLDVVGTTGPRAMHMYAETLSQKSPSRTATPSRVGILGTPKPVSSEPSMWKDWLVTTTLLLPFNKRGVMRPEVNEEPYVGTRWVEGSGWSTAVISEAAPTVFGNYFLVALAILLIIILIIVWIRYTKTQGTISF